ncbi:MAG: hypothetical protein Q8P63_01510 [Candidatus Nealsonbacteria bacterium]|nr:hypothetical protein [Candidatus Nealsonbacteria bacterium]
MVSALDTFVSYIDILTLALAESAMCRFDPDIDKWHAAVLEIWKKYKDEIPELKRICFVDDRHPLAPMSDQVYSLRIVLARSGEMPMSPKVKRQIIKREETRLAKYAEEIKGIAAIFEKHLEIRK